MFTLNGVNYGGGSGHDPAGGGWRLWWEQMFADYIADAAAKVSAASGSASAASGYASAASGSATSAAGYAAALSGTSTTSTAVGTGSKTLTTQAAKQFAPGQFVIIARTSAPTTTWMQGQVTAYNSGTGSLTVSVSDIAGSGTYTDWSILLCGQRGATGATGANGADGTGIPTIGGGDGKKIMAVNPGATAALWVARPLSLCQIFTAGGTFTPDSQIDKYLVIAIGGGGGGCVINSSRRGGQAGQAIFGVMSITSAQTITIGAGGAAATGNPGNAGSDTSIGTLLVAKGGAAGNAAGSPVTGGGTVPSGCVQLDGAWHESVNSVTASEGGASWLQGFVSGAAARYGCGGLSVTTGTSNAGGDGIVIIIG